MLSQSRNSLSSTDTAWYVALKPLSATPSSATNTTVMWGPDEVRSGGRLVPQNLGTVYERLFLCIVSHNSIFPLPSIHTKALAEINSDSLTCPALVQLQCRSCREPPRSQTRTRPASPGWSSWSSAWPRDPPRQIHTTCTADGEPEISILQISAEFW